MNPMCTIPAICIITTVLDAEVGVTLLSMLGLELCGHVKFQHSNVVVWEGFAKGGEGGEDC